MEYLIKTIEEIERIFISDDNDILSDVSIRNILNKCCYPYELKNLNDDISKQIKIDYEEYINDFEFHFIGFDYELLSKEIDDKKFEAEIHKFIKSKENRFKKIFEEDIYHSLSDANKKFELIHTITELEDSFNKLKNLDTNKHQNIICKQICNSYLDVLEFITTKYNLVFPNFIKTFESRITEIRKNYQHHFKDISDWSYFIYPDKKNEFLEIERKLTSRGYLDENLKWDKANNDLVRLFNNLNKRELFMKSQKKSVLKSFEKRYSVNLGKFVEPARVKKLEDVKGKFDFLYDYKT